MSDTETLAGALIDQLQRDEPVIWKPDESYPDEDVRSGGHYFTVEHHTGARFTVLVIEEE